MALIKVAPAHRAGGHTTLTNAVRAEVCSTKTVALPKEWSRNADTHVASCAWLTGQADLAKAPRATLVLTADWSHLTQQYNFRYQVRRHPTVVPDPDNPEPMFDTPQAAIAYWELTRGNDGR